MVTKRQSPKGEIKNPGVYEVTDKTIINDVIKDAGGFTKKAYTTNINLSKKVSDELVIYVYSKDEYKNLTKTKEPEVIIQECNCPTYDISECIQSGNSEITSNKNINTDITVNNSSQVENKQDNENDKLININTSTKKELMTLTGIGESKANAIIEYRKQNKFVTIDDLKKVNGIGDAMFEKIKNNITV